MIDPAEEFDDLRGGLRRALDEPVPRHHRWPRRRPSYEATTISAVPKAAAFSTDEELSSALDLIVELQAHEFGAALMELTMPHHHVGRRRTPGSWIMVYLIYVCMALTSMKQFHRHLRKIVFPLCGFGDWIPAYTEMTERFKELVGAWECFVDAVALLIATVDPYVPQLGHCGFVDATSFLSPHVVLDACTDPEECRAAGDDSPWRIASASAIEQARAKDAEKEPDEHDLQPDLTRRGLIRLTQPSGQLVWYRRFFANGHWGLCLDLTAGFRRYGAGTSWLGGLTLAYVVPPFGLPLAISPVPADIQEWDAYPPLFDLICRILGHPPLVVSVDRGPAIKAFYLYNTLRGVAVAGPRRLRPNIETHLDWRHPKGIYDEDGVLRCKHCRLPGRQHGSGLGLYFTDKGEPRIRSRCVTPFDDPRCAELQSESCLTDPVNIIPLSRVHPLYSDARYVHHNKESVFHHERQRSATNGKDQSMRLNVAGVPAQRLRGWASLFLDWFQLALRHGFIEPRTMTVKRNPLVLTELSSKVDPRTGAILRAGVGADRYLNRLDERRANHTDLPLPA
jgi:hypothetical protein